MRGHVHLFGQVIACCVGELVLPSCPQGAGGDIVYDPSICHIHGMTIAAIVCMELLRVSILSGTPVLSTMRLIGKLAPIVSQTSII